MSAEVLRKAAALMRERAQAATPGPWKVKQHAARDNCKCIKADGTYVAMYAANDAEHIASWDPAMAFSVANLMDHAAEDREETGTYNLGEWVDLLAIARTYLGADS